MAFFTNADAFQDALNSCLSVRDWEILTGAIQIPENFVPMAFARLTELTVQEFEVSWKYFARSVFYYYYYYYYYYLLIPFF